MFALGEVNVYRVLELFDQQLNENLKSIFAFGKR